ncbi:MAG: hypothetical protein N2578_04565 [Bdellovibrionaceae bacterium]|nr:hypothetical protein [Pseudobdellovibrionaceae bacterium]
MRLIYLASLVCLSFTCWATTGMKKGHRGTAQASPSPSVNSSHAGTQKSIFSAAETDRRMYLATNIVGLSKGQGNASIDFFLNEKWTLGLRVHSASSKEKRKKNEVTAEMSVDRTTYTLGASFFLFGAESQRNLIIGAGLGFLTDKDPVDVDQRTGLSLKLAGTYRMKKDLFVELGVHGNNAETGSDFKGDLIAGLGYLF